jgi:hypothetical protein
MQPTWLDEGVVAILFVLFLKERISVEPDHPVRDAASTKLVADGFGHQHDDLR